MIREAALGPEHPKVAVSLNNLGACLFSQGKEAEAAMYFERALSIRRKTLGPKHPTLANSLINLSQILVHQGRYAEALPRLEEAVDIRESALGPNHPDLAVALISLAEGLVWADRPGEAVSYAERAVAVRENVSGDSTILAMARFALAQALWASGKDRPRAIVLAKRARDELDDDPGLKEEADRIDEWLANVR
jgi:tetratricopeptide (TPR) repeat protein